MCAYWFAKDVPGADIGYCQEKACRDPYWAYLFARDVLDADIGYCQERVYKEQELHVVWTLISPRRDFPLFIEEADIEYCYKRAEKFYEIEEREHDEIRRYIIEVL